MGLSRPVRLWAKREVLPRLATRTVPDITQGLIDPNCVERVLLCRLNYRIGNVLFLTPLIQSMRRAFPNARLELLTGNASAASELLAGLMPQESIVGMPQRLLTSPRQTRDALSFLKSPRDLVIDPSKHSLSNRAVARLTRAPLKIGFQSPDPWRALTHATTPPREPRHDAQYPLTLLRRLLGSDKVPDQPLHIRLSEAEQVEGNATVASLLAAGALPSGTSGTIAYFCGARGTKARSREWWRALLAPLHARLPGARFIEVLAPGVYEPAVTFAQPYATPSLRTLAAVIANTDLFLSLDTGPMHLASATGTPTIGLFAETDPGMFGPLGDHDLAINTAGSTSSDIAEQIANHARSLRSFDR